MILLAPAAVILCLKMQQQPWDSMPVNNYSPNAQRVLERAHDLAALFLHQQIEPEHICLALLRDQGCSAKTILQSINVNLNQLANQFEERLLGMPSAAGAQPQGSAQTTQLLARSQLEARRLGLNEIGTSLLLIALAQEEEGFVANRLREHGIHGNMVSTIAEAQRRIEADLDPDRLPLAEGRKVEAPTEESGNMNFYNFFSFSAKKAIFRASEICEQFNNQYLEPEHVYYSILNLRSCSAVQVLHQLNVNLPRLTYTIEAYLYEHAGTYKGAPQFSKRTINLLDASFAEVKRLHHREIGTTHLLIALAQDRDSFLAGLFDEHSLNAKKVRDTFVEHLSGFGQSAGAADKPGIASPISVKREGLPAESDYIFRLSQILDCAEGFGAHFNSEALLALALGASAARRLRHPELSAAHVMLGLISLPFDPQRSLTESIGVDSAALLSGLYRSLTALPPQTDYSLPRLGDEGQKLLEHAFGVSVSRHAGSISALCLLIACLALAEGELRAELASAGLSAEKLAAVVGPDEPPQQGDSAELDALREKLQRESTAIEQEQEGRQPGGKAAGPVQDVDADADPDDGGNPADDVDDAEE